MQRDCLGLCHHSAQLKILAVMSRFFSPLSHLFLLVIAVGLLGCWPLVLAQNAASLEDNPQASSTNTSHASAASKTGSDSSEQNTASPADSSAPLLGAGDELEITIFGVSDLTTHARVGSDGNISMPLVGDIRVAGLTSREAEGAIAAGLRRNHILNNPQVSVYVKEYTNSEISVVGQIVKPGVYSTLGPHRLLDILQLAGGLTEKAANEASIAHRGGGNAITVELPKNPGEMARNNVELLPGDTVVVPSAGVVYVLGEVTKPGGYVLNSSGGTTVLQVVGAAGGPTRLAALGRAKMIRRTQNGLQERPVPLNNLLHAKVADIPLEPDDILYVPGSRLKSALSAGQLLTIAGSAAVYRIP